MNRSIHECSEVRTDDDDDWNVPNIFVGLNKWTKFCLPSFDTENTPVDNEYWIVNAINRKIF